jgi:hypothetical protein
LTIDDAGRVDFIAENLRLRALIPDRIERRSDSKLVGRLRRPCDLGRHAKQAVVFVIHPVQIEPYDRLGKRLDQCEVYKPCAAERLNAGTTGELPVVVPLIVSTDIADNIGIDRRQRRIDGNRGVLDTGE